MSACANCSHDEAKHGPMGCYQFVKTEGDIGVCLCRRFVAVGGETAAPSEPRPLTLEEIEVTVIGRIKTAFYDAGLPEEEIARRATWVTNGLPKWRESASSEPGSCAADVDGATQSRGLHESVGERQGRQPGSLDAAVGAASGASTAEGMQRVTHGRHCRCTACATEDWLRITGPCGMHGKECPAVYEPLGNPGDLVVARTAVPSLDSGPKGGVR